MQIFVRLVSGKTLCVDTEGSSCTVGRIYAMIEEREGMCDAKQRLVFGGIQMDEHDTLSEYGITSEGGQTLHLLLSLSGGMPATAPRIKMPANNRMHSSAALRTTDMWSNVIGDDFGKANDSATVGGSGGAGNAYEMSQNLLALARLSGAAKGGAKRGACKKCGEIGHLAFQCFNQIQAKKQEVGDISSTSSDDDDDDSKSISSISSTSSEGSTKRSPRAPMPVRDGDKSTDIYAGKRKRDDSSEKKEKEKKHKKEKKSHKDKKEKKHKKHKKSEKKHKSKKEKKHKSQKCSKRDDSD